MRYVGKIIEIGSKYGKLELLETGEQCFFTRWNFASEWTAERAHIGDYVWCSLEQDPRYPKKHVARQISIAGNWESSCRK